MNREGGNLREDSPCRGTHQERADSPIRTSRYQSQSTRENWKNCHSENPLRGLFNSY